MKTYPLREHAAGELRAASGLPLEAIDAAALDAGALTIDDTRISAEALLAQAAIARSSGNPQLADNLERAAELTAVPNERILTMYNALRPGRSSLAELQALASELEQHYAANRCAAFVREAIEVYAQRQLFRRDG